MKKIAVILSGSGIFDGSEIHEATLSLLSICQQGAEYTIFAPDIEQHHVINHITGREMPEKRNVLIESARIARGKISPISKFKVGDFDGLLFPGGFGVVKNLCDFVFKGTDCSVNPDVEKVVKAMHAASKPIGALCIAPVLIARILGDVELTIGQDKGTAEAIEHLGCKHINTKYGEVIHDKKNNVFTTPCYMLDSNIAQVYEGTSNIVKAMLENM